MTEGENSSNTAQTQDQEGFVSSYLLYLLAAASEAASSQFHQKVRACGLRVPEWRVIACLHDQDGEMITRLAEFALIEQSRLTRIIDQMHARGLLVRKPDTADKRRVRVYLTGRGKKLAKQLVADAKQHESALLSTLEKANGGDIKKSLRTLLDSLS
ncbi:MarR family transcriptional regulator [Chromatiales bacterium (ex Bugula neritina AB1)]|nr:MarR family transcriptional regulator [Chromatiales bacterium (ex Bugula neritina AB1)]